MEDNPTAPAEAPASEANQPTTTNEAPAQAPDLSQATMPKPTANIPEDQIEAFNKFVESNGGYEKAFSKLKSAVSAPAQVAQPQQPPRPQQPAQQPGQAQPPMPANPADQIPDGYMTGSEFLAKQYFQSLANEEKYQGMSEDIMSGKVLTEMVDFGMTPVKSGMLNDRVIRKYLDMRARNVTPPATPTSTPINSAPTVDYVNVGDKINSIDDARKVLAQNQSLSGSSHPMTQQAKDFIKEYYSKSK